jgi:hypothetical protein
MAHWFFKVRPLSCRPILGNGGRTAQQALEDHNMPIRMSRKAVDELIRKTIGPKRAVEKLFKSSTSKKWVRYEICGLDSGRVYVNLDKGTARVMDDKSRCRQPRSAKFAETKVAKASKS